MIHPFKRMWFFHQLQKNVRAILANNKLSNQEKGNYIYYHVFWKTWHECKEPNLYHTDMEMMHIQNHFIDILNKLGFVYPKKHMYVLKQFKKQYYPTAQVGLIRMGCLARDIDYITLRLNLWHFGNTTHLK